MVIDHNITDGVIFCDICPKKIFFTLDGFYRKHMKEKHNQEWIFQEQWLTEKCDKPKNFHYDWIHSASKCYDVNRRF